MTFGELFFLFYVYKLMPSQGRQCAWNNIAYGVFLLGQYVYTLPCLINGIGRNIITPGYVDLHVKNVKFTDSDNMNLLYDVYGFDGTPSAWFDATLRNLHMTHVSFDGANSYKTAKLQNFANNFEKLALAHEMRHAQVNKYVCSTFFRKRDFYYICILDEISAIIQEQFAYVGMDLGDDNLMFRAHQVHSKIIKRHQFRSCKNDVTSPEYIELFNSAVVSDTYVRRTMINGALKRFEDCLLPWCKAISKIKVSSVPFAVDFYRLPISFNTARRKILTYDIGGKSVSFYDSMSAQDRAHFDARIYAIADIICTHMR